MGFFKQDLQDPLDYFFINDFSPTVVDLSAKLICGKHESDETQFCRGRQTHAGKINA